MKQQLINQIGIKGKNMNIIEALNELNKTYNKHDENVISYWFRRQSERKTEKIGFRLRLKDGELKLHHIDMKTNINDLLADDWEMLTGVVPV